MLLQERDELVREEPDSEIEATMEGRPSRYWVEAPSPHGRPATGQRARGAELGRGALRGQVSAHALNVGE
jgi:hypothetical protein